MLYITHTLPYNQHPSYYNLPAGARIVWLRPPGRGSSVEFHDDSGSPSGPRGRGGCRFPPDTPRESARSDCKSVGRQAKVRVRVRVRALAGERVSG